MSTFDTIKSQLQGLLKQANATTGNNDTNLTDGVNALIGGYGKGGVNATSSNLLFKETTLFTDTLIIE